MIFFLTKIIFSSFLIAFASWLSIKKPVLAGFIIALPIVSMISIFFSYFEKKDFEKTMLFAKSIFVGVPLTLTFFIPFLFAKNLGLNFLLTYSLGIIFLIAGYFLHKIIMNTI